MQRNLQNTQRVAVIGAGIVGVSTAIWLQRDGYEVALIDKEGPAAGTSFGNAGILASCGITPVTAPGLVSKAPKMLFDSNQPLFLKWRYLPKLFPWLAKYLARCNEDDYRSTAEAMFNIIGDSLEQHESLANGTKAAKFIIPSDYCYIYPDRKAFETDALAWDIRKYYGFDYKIYEGDAVASYQPGISSDQRFLVSMGGHGRITDPGAYVVALADHFTKQGGKFLKGALEGFRHDEVGGLKAVIVDGNPVACDKAVVAAGAWSKPMMKMLGFNVPLESERGYHLEFWNPNFMPRQPTMVTVKKFAATPMEGRLRVGGIVEFGGLKAGPSKAPFELLQRQIREIFPSLKWEEMTSWMGHRPAPTDSIPIIGEITGNKNVYAGFGHHHVGLTGGAKTGRIISQLIAGKKPNFDLEQYSPNRFQ